MRKYCTLATVALSTSIASLVFVTIFWPINDRVIRLIYISLQLIDLVTNVVCIFLFSSQHDNLYRKICGAYICTGIDSTRLKLMSYTKAMESKNDSSNNHNINHVPDKTNYKTKQKQRDINDHNDTQQDMVVQLTVDQIRRARTRTAPTATSVASATTFGVSKNFRYVQK